MKPFGLRTVLPALLLACFAGWVIAADAPAPKPLDVRDLMTVSQFHQAGLDKLSPDELQALNAWLNNYTHPQPAPAVAAAAQPAAPAAVAAPVPAAATGAAAFGGEMLPQKSTADSDIPDVLQSRILGNFQGWSGHNVFRLENGQVWVQADSTSSFDTNLQDPVVVIKKTALGHYLLTLPGHSGTVFVRRIQ